MRRTCHQNDVLYCCMGSFARVSCSFHLSNLLGLGPLLVARVVVPVLPLCHSKARANAFRTWKVKEVKSDHFNSLQSSFYVCLGPAQDLTDVTWANLNMRPLKLLLKMEQH